MKLLLIDMRKTLAGALGLAMAFSLVAVPSAGAQTVAELQAQINALLAQISALQAQLSGQTGGTMVGGCSFTRDLTTGSTGADVTCLQNYLTGTGHFTFSGGATGYFGPITQAAVAAWQAANGITPPAGYFGPISRGAYNSMVVVTPGPGTTPTTPSGSGITTPGVEGTLTVTRNATPSSGSTVREGETRVPVLGLKIEALNSDLAIQRVKLNLGTNTSIYTKVFNRVYLLDGSTVVAEMPLDSSTVFEEGTTKFVQITGFNWVVPKNVTRVLTVAMDVHSTVKSADQGSKTITLPANGVRALDGAGIDQQGPTASFSNSVTVSTSLVDNASLLLSLNTGSPDAREAICDQNSDEDECDELEVGRFDVKAEKDAVEITDFTISIAKTGSGAATATTVYLYDGSTLIGSEAIGTLTGIAVIDDIDWVIPKDTTRTITVKVDIRDANSTAAVFTASATSTSPLAENSEGSTVTPSGSATAETVTVRNAGPEFTLLSKTIEKSSTPINNNTSTSTAKGTFTVRVKAVGGDVMFGTVASTSPAFGTSTSFFEAYQSGSASTLLVASTTSYTTPGSGVVTTGLTESFTLQEGNQIDLPVSFTFEGRTTTGSLVSTASYAIGLEQIQWVGPGGLNTSTFMGGETSWRTSDVSMP
jgi:peptidoglycan hydrolase-like protein with peptidoglycan-binding domain